MYFNENDDIREDVFYSMSAIKTPILEMQAVRMSLEDIFIKVTQDEGLSDKNNNDNTGKEGLNRCWQFIRKSCGLFYLNDWICIHVIVLKHNKLYFYLHNLSQRVANFEYTVSNVSFIFVLLVPLLTMRIIAEENRQKTDQLLLTSPLTATDIVLGKFFAVFSILAMIIAVISAYPLIMARYGKVSFASAYAVS